MEGLGFSPVLVKDVGYTYTKESVDQLIPRLQAALKNVDASVPVVLYNMDSSCFRAVTTNGDMVSITKNSVDGRYHVQGELVVTPLSLLNNTTAEINRLGESLGNRQLYVMGAMPRYILRSCCSDPDHCSNVRGTDDMSISASMAVLQDLQELNRMLARRMSKGNVHFLHTSQLFAGNDHTDANILMEAMISFWSVHPVHGSKVAYTKIAASLVDKLKKGDRREDADLRTTLDKKRRRDDSPDTPPRGRDNGRERAQFPPGAKRANYPGISRFGDGGSNRQDYRR
jgi:hypothetical protein